MDSHRDARLSSLPAAKDADAALSSIHSIISTLCRTVLEGSCIWCIRLGIVRKKCCASAKHDTCNGLTARYGIAAPMFPCGHIRGRFCGYSDTWEVSPRPHALKNDFSYLDYVIKLTCSYWDFPEWVDWEFSFLISHLIGNRTLWLLLMFLCAAEQ